MNDDYVDLGDIVLTALENGDEITIELDDEYGWHVTIEDECVTDFGSEGIPWEHLNIGIPPEVAEQFEVIER